MRYFEKVSKEQWEKDGLDVHMYDIHTLPIRSTAKSAGYDFFLTVDIDLAPGEDIKFPTGIRAIMGDDEVLNIYTRSGYGFKNYLRLSNQTGIVDSDYKNAKNEGHIWIKIRNESDKHFHLDAFNEDGSQNKIVQGIFQKYLLVDGDGFDGNQRLGGIGSTG
jgi:dUTP pyrophosphatase